MARIQLPRHAEYQVVAVFLAILSFIIYIYIFFFPFSPLHSYYFSVSFFFFFFMKEKEVWNLRVCERENTLCGEQKRIFHEEVGMIRGQKERIGKVFCSAKYPPLHLSVVFFFFFSTMREKRQRVRKSCAHAEGEESEKNSPPPPLIQW